MSPHDAGIRPPASPESVDDGWYRAMFEASTVPMALADEEGLLRAANVAYCAMVGRSWPEIEGRSSRDFTHPDDLAQHHAMDSLMADAADRGDILRVEKRYLHPDGTVRWGWVSASAVTGPGGRAWTMAVIHDTTDRRRIEDHLQTAATTDPLTGLLNRRGWQYRLTQFESTPVRLDRLVLAIIDLDRFKSYNDTHGHTAGDRLLAEFAGAATAVVSPPGVVARWGGEEFAVALPHATADAAGQMLRELAAVVPDGQTFCAGHTSRRPRETTLECFARADTLLYDAKRIGGGGHILGD